MTFSNFPLDLGSGVSHFSNLLSTAIADAGKQLQTEIQPCDSIANEDKLALWAVGMKDICYGRDLLYKALPFWAGLRFEKDKEKTVSFIIWFYKENLSDSQRTTLQNMPGSNSFGKEIWITLDDPLFEKFCQTSNPQILSTFIINVLQNL